MQLRFMGQRNVFSVNGSTAALLAAVSASVSKGGRILVARNCHKAVYHALYLRELQPVYIYPHEDHRLGINGGFLPSVWKDIWKKIRMYRHFC